MGSGFSPKFVISKVGYKVYSDKILIECKKIVF